PRGYQSPGARCDHNSGAYSATQPNRFRPPILADDSAGVDPSYSPSSGRRTHLPDSIMADSAAQGLPHLTNQCPVGHQLSAHGNSGYPHTITRDDLPGAPDGD